MWVPKTAAWQKTGEPLTLNETLRNTYFSSSFYQDVGIELQDLSSSEIKLYIQEFWSRYKGLWVDSLIEQSMHDRFWATLEDWKDYRNYHDWRHDQCRVSSEWLKKQSQKFLEN